jgi:hypothetical protein
MSFTRFHDDPNRIENQLLQSTFTARYLLDTPGPGTALPFFEDPQIRLQKWGANLRTEQTNLESNLRNLHVPLNRDLIAYNEKPTPSNNVDYPFTNPFVQESRASHPAWMYKDLEQIRWEEPFLNPLANIEIKFPHNVDTKREAKDTFIR